MWGVKKTSIALVVAGVVLTACAGSSPARTSPATTLPTQRCGNEVQVDFDPGLESRRNFKLAVRLDARADATVRTKTPGTSLMFDREAARQDNVYRLADGTKRVRFTGCPDRSALFVGAVLSTGPTTVDLDVTTNGQRTPVTIAAFDQ
jgi:hypothetical protein